MFPAASYPDITAIDYAIQFAEGTKNVEAKNHLERLKARSDAYASAYGTHLPLLAAVVATAPDGPVLELGAGHSSTPLLSAMCRAMGRRLFTLESDDKWRYLVADLVGGHHEFLRIDDYYGGWAPMITSLGISRFAVAFVDHCNGNSERMPAVEFLRGKCDFIVVHDTKNTFFAGLDEVLDSFKYRHDYCFMAPVTTVVSDLYDVRTFR